MWAVPEMVNGKVEGLIGFRESNGQPVSAERLRYKVPSVVSFQPLCDD